MTTDRELTTIWKFTLQMVNVQTIDLADSAECLTVQVQHGQLQLWARVPKDAGETKPRRFFIHGTGHDVHPDAGRYIGTVQFDDGSLIFHVFEEA